MLREDRRSLAPVTYSPALHAAMNSEAESATSDGGLGRLRQCIDDLINVPSLPALWSGRSPSQAVGMLLRRAVQMLHLEFAYARVGGSAGSARIEAIRCGHRRQQRIHLRIVGKALEPWLSGN